MRAAKVQASLRIPAVSPEPPLLAHTSSESRGTFRQKARSLAPLNGWACAVKICHDGMLEDTNLLGAPHLVCSSSKWRTFYQYFTTYKIALIKQSMTADIRSMAGLGYPPQLYNQNANECMNSVIKRELKWKRLNPLEVVSHIQHVVNRQFDEAKLASMDVENIVSVRSTLNINWMR